MHLPEEDQICLFPMVVWLPFMKERSMRSRFHGLVLVLLSCGACAGTEKSLSDAAPPVEPLTLLDLSGLTWIEGDEFLGVHDAKDNAEKHNWPRVSRLRLPQNELDGVLWTVVPLEFPGPPGRGSDLESACSIPGGRGFLICESGQEGVDDRRIFHLIQRGDEFRINSYIT